MIKGFLKLILFVVIMCAAGLAITIAAMNVLAEQPDDIEAIYAALVQDEEFEPLWAAEAGFRNTAAVHFRGNNALPNSLRGFWREHGRYITNPYSGLRDSGGYIVNPAMNAAIREAITGGLARDSISMPFTRSYFDMIVNDVNFYLAAVPDDMTLGYDGQYVSLFTRSYIFVNTYEIDADSPEVVELVRELDGWLQTELAFIDQAVHASEVLVSIFGPQDDITEWQQEMAAYRAYLMNWAGDVNTFLRQLLAEMQDISEFLFVFVTLHELGHALGLGESLADLFAESVMGMDGPVREYTRFEMLDVAVMDSNLAYDSTFDRSLLRRLERQGRGGEFWEAAFHSEARYQELWDSEFGEYVSSFELQTARAVFYMSMSDDSISGSVSGPFLEYSGGITLDFAGILLLRDWRAFAEEGNQDALNRAIWLIGIFNEFAYTRNIEPQPNVLDFVIASHIFRHG